MAPQTDPFADYKPLGAAAGAPQTAAPSAASQADPFANYKPMGAENAASETAPQGSWWDHIKGAAKDWFSPLGGLNPEQKAAAQKFIGAGGKYGGFATDTSQPAFSVLSPEEQEAFHTIGEHPWSTALRHGEYAKAAHGALGEIGAVGAMALMPGSSAWEAPIATLAGLAAGTIGSVAGKATAKGMGASEDTANLVGDVSGIAAGLGGSKLGQMISPGVYEFFGTRLSPKRAAMAPRGAQLQPAINNTQDEVVQYAAKKGIELTPFQATRQPLAQGAESVGERSLIGGGKLQEAREGEAMKVGQNVLEIAKRLDPAGVSISDETAGEAIQRAASTAEDISHAQASAKFKALPEDLLDSDVDVSEINTKYRERLAQAQNALENRNPQVAAQVRQALEQGADLGTGEKDLRKPVLSFRDAQKVRSDAIKDGPALMRAGAPSEIQSIYAGLARDLDAAMEKTAGEKGAAAAWREANASWRAHMDKYNDLQSPLHRILAQRDSKQILNTLLQRGSANDVALMQTEHMEGGLQALRGAVIRDIATRNFRVNGEGLGGYSDAFLRTLLGPGTTKELYLNGALARSMNYAFNPSQTSNVLLSAEQLTNPSRFWPFPFAARGSMPRSAGTAPATRVVDGGGFFPAPEQTAGLQAPVPKMTPQAKAGVVVFPSAVRRLLGGGEDQ